MTNVFTTPCISAIVIMSPFATWLISWASTASASFCDMPLSRPVLTATSALLRRAPVANAFISGVSKMPTSGMPMPAFSACTRTVSTSQRSVAVDGWSMTRTPIIRLAVHLDMASEIREPVKPTTAAKASSDPMSRPTPWASRIRSMPSRRRTTPNTTMMAIFVTRNRKMRFIEVGPLTVG